LPTALGAETPRPSPKRPRPTTQLRTGGIVLFVITNHGASSRSSLSRPQTRVRMLPRPTRRRQRAPPWYPPRSNVPRQCSTTDPRTLEQPILDCPNGTTLPATATSAVSLPAPNEVESASQPAAGTCAPTRTMRCAHSTEQAASAADIPTKVVTARLRLNEVRRTRLSSR